MLEIFIRTDNHGQAEGQTDGAQIIIPTKKFFLVGYTKIQLNKFQRGPGTWKFNSNLLRNKSYVELINNAIHETTLKYIVPIYNLDKVCDIPTNEIRFTIDDSLFLDTLLMNIRGKSTGIRFSGKEKRKQNNKQQELIKDIEKLESNQTLCNLTSLIHLKIKNQKFRKSVTSN